MLEDTGQRLIGKELSGLVVSKLTSHTVDWSSNPGWDTNLMRSLRLYTTSTVVRYHNNTIGFLVTIQSVTGSTLNGCHGSRLTGSTEVCH